MMDRSRSDLPLLTAIGARYSPRAFSARAVTATELELVLEAARMAPSSMNEQPWRFLVTLNGEEGHAALLDCLSPGNRLWADKAPVLVLAMAHRFLQRTGGENRHARHDLGVAVGQLGVQATAMGLGLHQLGGFDADRTRTAFSIPDELDLVSVIALGWPGVAASLPEQLRAREEVRSARRPLTELVFRGHYPG